MWWCASSCLQMALLCLEDGRTGAVLWRWNGVYNREWGLMQINLPSSISGGNHVCHVTLSFSLWMRQSLWLQNASFWVVTSLIIFWIWIQWWLTGPRLVEGPFVSCSGGWSAVGMLYDCIYLQEVVRIHLQSMLFYAWGCLGCLESLKQVQLRAPILLWCPQF